MYKTVVTVPSGLFIIIIIIVVVVVVVVVVIVLQYKMLTT
jgi:hypothetical protein